MNEPFIPIAAPMLTGNEKAYVLDCLDSTWISSTGKYIELFEAAFATFCGARHAISCSNGTTALHLALLALGVGPGDEVIVPTLTFVATANAVKYCGARPVFVDSQPDTWTIDPKAIVQKITPLTRGIIPVHLFGHPADMDAVLALARRHNLFVLEDAAQAHGAEYRGKRVGSLGDAGTFSFFGNKIVTTGEGGMVVTNDDGLAARMRLFKNHGMDPTRRYWFPVVGYNYRMTNIAAAIGLAQLERVDWHIARHIENASWYRENLRDAPGISWQSEQAWARHVWWMFTVLLDEDHPLHPGEVIDHLRKRGVEGRPVVHPMHVLPPYRHSMNGESFPVADRIAQRGVSLPSSAGLSREDIRHVSHCILEAIGAARLL